MKFAGGPKAKRLNPQMGTDQRKEIKYRRIKQISSEASDTVKDSTLYRRNLEPVQDTGRSYQLKTAAKLGQNDLDEWGMICSS